MHSILPRQPEVLQNVELSGTVEKAWSLVSDPFHMISWMGLHFHCLELDMQSGGRIVFAGVDGDREKKRFGVIVDCFAPYKFSYRYEQLADDHPQFQHLVIVSLMVLPQNCCMVSVHESGFASYEEFETASLYWRKALLNLQKLMPL